MGEYALYNGERIKIGTCENMYYLRFDQRHLIRHESGSVDVQDPGTLAIIRFRFPWPDEDENPPGCFEDPFRALGLYGVEAPKDVKHETMQFRSDRGYLISLPCPEGCGMALLEGRGPKFSRNGNPGPVRIVQQAFRGGNLALICECGACETKWNLPTFEHVKPVLARLEEKAKYSELSLRDAHRAKLHREIARRIMLGYPQSEVEAYTASAA